MVEVVVVEVYSDVDECFGELGLGPARYAGGRPTRPRCMRLRHGEFDDRASMPPWT